MTIHKYFRCFSPTVDILQQSHTTFLVFAATFFLLANSKLPEVAVLLEANSFLQLYLKANGEATHILK